MSILEQHSCTYEANGLFFLIGNNACYIYANIYGK